MARVINSIVLEKSLRTIFMVAYNALENPAEIMPFITQTTSNSNKEKYGWLGEAPQMSEWIDERKLKALNDFDYEIPNKDYEATLSVSRNDLDDDQMSGIRTRISDLATKARVSHPRKQFYNLIANGEVDLCYDGQPFFSASHEEGESGIQSNIVTGTGVSFAELVADLDSCESRLLSFKDDIGEPRNEGDIMMGVVCSELLKPKFRSLNTLDYIATGVDNPYKGRISSIVSSSRLSDKNDFYVADLSMGVKPIIWQARQAVTFEALERGSHDSFMRKTNYYGVDSREGWGYGLWYKMVKVKNT